MASNDNAGQSLSELNDIIRSHPSYAPAYQGRGGIYAHKKELKKALEDMATAVQLAPNVAGAYLDRAAVYAAIGDFERATADVDSAARLNPKSPKLDYAREALAQKIKEAEGGFSKPR